MKTVRDRRASWSAVLFASTFIACTNGASAQEIESKTYLHSIDTCPISPLIKIYAVHYNYEFSPRNELITGLGYTNIDYPEYGRSHAPTLILGYRRYLWNNLHLEYELWPSYNAFYGYKDQKYYNGYELWNEARIGNRFDFTFNNIPMYFNLQCLFGYGLYSQNKPASFNEFSKKQSIFIAPIAFLGMRF